MEAQAQTTFSWFSHVLILLLTDFTGVGVCMIALTNLIDFEISIVKTFS